MEAVQALKQSSFLRHNAVFFAGSVAVGVLNYAFYPVLGRLLPPEAFGELQVLVSLFLQFTIFLNVLSLVTVNIAVNYSDKSAAHRMMFELEKFAAYIAAGLLLLSIVAGEFLRSSLQFESVLPFIALALAMIVSIPLTFRSGFARGQKRFGVASVSQLIAASGKIALSAGLVVAGLGVTGAVFGIVAAQLLAFFYAARWAARLGFARPKDTNYGTLPNIRLLIPELKYAAVALVGLLTITLMMSIDVIIVKAFFDAKTAGLYAGIATVARAIFFLATPISQVLMPLVKIGRPEAENRQYLLKSLLLTGVICGGATAVCVLFPGEIVRVLMGVDYITYTHLLPPLAVSICIISIVNLFGMYCLALRRKIAMLVGIIGFAVVAGLMLARHHTLDAVVYSMLTGSIAALCITAAYVLANVKRGRHYAQ